MKYDPGIHDVAEKSETGEARGFSVSLDITDHTDPSVEIHVEAFASLDGASWEYAGGCRRIGGESFNINRFYGGDGKRITQAGFTFQHSSPKWVNPLVKVLMEVEGKSLTTSVEVVKV